MIPTLLQRYVLREMLRVALLSALALTAIIFVGMSVSRVQQGLNVVQLRGLIPYIAAFSLPYALPTALLVASVFVFGRLSGANELTAVASSGVNLNHIILPPVLLAVMISAVTFGLNHYLLPWALSEVRSQGDRLIGEALRHVGRVQRIYPIGRYRIYVGGVDEATGHWRHVAVIEFGADDFPTQIMIADRGTCIVDKERSIATLILLDGMTMTPELGDVKSVSERAAVGFGEMSFEISLATSPSSRPKYATLPELRQSLRELRREAAEIRVTDPELARVAHPRTERRLAERADGKALRAYNKVKNLFNSRSKSVAKARARLEKAQEEQRTAEASHDLAAERRDERREQVEGRKPIIEKLQAELESYKREEAAPERVAECEKALRKAKVEMTKLSARLKAAEGEVEEKARALEAVQERLDGETGRVQEAVSAAADAQTEAQAARQLYEAEHSRVSKIKILESVLRAETVLHFRNAGSVTSLMFVLIGIPLGILSRRGSVIVAFAIAFFAVLMIYYPLMVVGQMLSGDGYLNPAIAQWMSNAVVGAISVVLLGWCIRR